MPKTLAEIIEEGLQDLFEKLDEVSLENEESGKGYIPDSEIRDALSSINLVNEYNSYIHP